MIRINLTTHEWVDAEEVEWLFSITRGTLHKLADSGQIKSVLIRTKANARKGIWLFNVQSIRDFLEAQSVS